MYKMKGLEAVQIARTLCELVAEWEQVLIGIDRKSHQVFDMGNLERIGPKTSQTPTTRMSPFWTETLAAVEKLNLELEAIRITLNLADIKKAHPNTADFSGRKQMKSSGSSDGLISVCRKLHSRATRVVRTKAGDGEPYMLG